MINLDKSVIIELKDDNFDFRNICYESKFIPDFNSKFILTMYYTKILNQPKPTTQKQAYEVIKYAEYILHKKFIERKDEPYNQ